MTERVDVLAYDVPAPRSGDERRRRRGLGLATVVVASAVVAVGFVRGTLLLAAIGATLVVLVRCLLFAEDRELETTYRTVEAGRGGEIVSAHEAEATKRSRMRKALSGLVALGVVAYGVFQGSLLLSIFGGGAIATLGVVVGDDHDLPRVVESDVDRDRAARRFDLSPDATRDTEREDRYGER